MSITFLTRRQLLASVVALAALTAPLAATAADNTQALQTQTAQPSSIEERLHESTGRQTDLQIARSRPDIREVEARVRDERANWTPDQWDEYARTMRGM
jgi:Ni/Co efflux regulator RcnB